MATIENVNVSFLWALLDLMICERHRQLVLGRDSGSIIKKSIRDVQHVVYERLVAPRSRGL